MPASEQNSRRAEKAELARHITMDETVAFMTALVAFLNEAETSAHHHDGIDAQPEPADLPSTPPHAADLAPLDLTPSDHQQASGDQHADASAPPADTISTALDAPLVADGVPHTEPTAGMAAITDGAVNTSVPADAHAVAPVAPLASDHPEASGGSSTHVDLATSIDPAPSLQQLGSTITSLVDTSLSALSHTLESLNTTVTQLTSAVTATVGQLTDGVTGLVGGLLHAVGGDAHDAHAPDLVGALVTDIVSTPLAAPHDAAATHGVDIAGLDTAGAVPMAALPPLTVHLGFLGQPADAHDVHDGAFSALGVHHF